jgi:hypothetical protein
MFVLRRIPALFSLLLLGAHFLRFGHVVLVACCLLLGIPLFIRRTAAQAIVSWVLGAGALIWIWTLVGDARERLAFGEPWIRLVVILGAVALFTAWSAWLLRQKPQLPSGREI